MKLPSIDIHSTKILSKNDILTKHSETQKYRSKFIRENLIHHNKKFASTQFIKVINNFIKNNKLHYT